MSFVKWKNSIIYSTVSSKKTWEATFIYNGLSVYNISATLYIPIGSEGAGVARADPGTHQHARPGWRRRNRFQVSVRLIMQNEAQYSMYSLTWFLLTTSLFFMKRLGILRNAKWTFACFARCVDIKRKNSIFLFNFIKRR